jgi:hypothetical protein
MDIEKWLAKVHMHLHDELTILDIAGDGMLFGDPHHTFSYNIAVAAKKGNTIAKVICEALNKITPDHCAKALAHEDSQEWKDAIGEIDKPVTDPVQIPVKSMKTTPVSFTLPPKKEEEKVDDSKSVPSGPSPYGKQK